MSLQPYSLSKLVKAGAKKMLASAGLEIHKSRRMRDLKDTFKMSLSDRFKNYHLGCGLIIAPGYLNIDANVELFTKKIGVPVQVQGSNGAFVLVYNLRYGIPAQVIY